MNHDSSGWATRLAVFATAFAVLAYEIALTRVFSVLFRSPYVFLILSIAVCGLGLGAALARLLRRPGLVTPALLLAVFLPLPVGLLLTLGRGLVAEANGVAVALFTLLPYVAAGWLLARAFEQQADQAGRLYFFDLAGAGLAALASVVLLGGSGGVALPFLLGGLVALAAAGLAAGRARVGGLLLAAALFGLFVAQQRTELLALPPVTATDPMKVKPLFQELADPAAGAEILYTRWSPVARTDVVRNKGVETLYIWTDGDVPTQMEPFRGNLAEVAGYAGFIGFVPYALQPAPRRVLAIGPGGGLDVLLALLGGARAIEPVEVNPAIVPITERFKGFYGDLYGRPEVQPSLIIDEGRSYLSRSKHRYDVLYFALAKTATTQQGGMALVDNYLYTVEAFEAYLDHLTDGGLLALVMQEPNLVDRVLVSAVEAMARRGLSGPQMAERIAWLSLDPDIPGGPYRELLLLRNGGFTPALTARLRALARERRLAPRMVPGRPLPGPYEVLRKPSVRGADLANALSQAYTLERMYPGGPWTRLDFSLVTDDRPFYVDFSPTLHPFLAALLRWSLLLGLLAVAAGSFAARRLGAGPAVGFGLYFGALGAGFLLVEIALIQKLVLLLGYPTRALSVILFALLLGSACGGWAANRGDAPRAARRLPAVILGLVALLGAAMAGLTPLTTALLAQPLALRVAAAVLVVLPLGFLMGQPFPTGLRNLGSRSELVPVAWAVNGVLSVTGSVLAAAIASELGYRAVLGAGAGIYLVALAAGPLWLGREQKEVPREGAIGRRWRTGQSHGADPGSKSGA